MKEYPNVLIMYIHIDISSNFKIYENAETCRKMHEHIENSQYTYRYMTNV